MVARPPSLALLALLLVQLLFAVGAQAQLIASNLPSCAQSCGVLQQAQASCESNPSSAQSCFCQSALLAPIKSAASNLCAPECGTTDWNTIASWYKSTCANGGTNAGSGSGSGSGTTTTTTAAAAPNGATAAAAASSSAPPSSNQGSGINQDQTGPQWWNTHWQWIVMVLVLIIAFTAIGVGGRIWYRRHHRKVDGEIEESAPQARPPDMGMWAPSRHSVHDFTGGTAAREQRPESTLAPLPQRKGTLSKGKHREGSRPPMPARTPSQRLKAAMESVQM